MKKSILIAALGVASVVASYGQGQILFENYVSSTQITGIYFGNGPNAGSYVGSEFSVQLYYGAPTDTSVSQMTPIGSPVKIQGAFIAGQGPGQNPANNQGTIGLSQLLVNALPAGTQYAFGFGATGVWQGQTYSGTSSFIQVLTTTPGAASPSPKFVDPTSFAVTAALVPEPATLALAGLGGLASLVMLRRKKA
jgi:hypothetical protein